MGINDSKLWISDIDEIINNLPELNDLASKRIMITGCTGLICSALVDVFIRWNNTHNEKIYIIAASRNQKKIQDRFNPYFQEDWFQIVSYDASMYDNDFDFNCDYIIHGASNATPNKIVSEPVETMLSNFIGLKCLLDYSKNNNVKRILYVSSSEVYGKKNDNNPYKTDEYGFINVLNSRNSYSIGKRAAETLCVSYYDEYGVDSVIVRPGHIYGPTAQKSDNRVSSAWAYAASNKEDIIMKSAGTQMRSYCYCLDCACAMIKVLLKGESVKAYNISNPDSVISIREMAKILAETGNVRLKNEAPTEDEKKGFNPMDNSSLDGSSLLKLGWRGLFDASRGLSHTVRIIAESD